MCPADAIYYDEDAPEEWAAYIKANADFFEQAGLSGSGKC